MHKLLCPELEVPCTAECPKRSTCQVHREPLFVHGNLFSFAVVEKDDKLLKFTMANIRPEAYLNGLVD